jgi:hypothetical protein
MSLTLGIVLTLPLPSKEEKNNVSYFLLSCWVRFKVNSVTPPGYPASSILNKKKFAPSFTRYFFPTMKRWFFCLFSLLPPELAYQNQANGMKALIPVLFC